MRYMVEDRSTGEVRVIDKTRLLASDWLSYSDRDSPLEDYNLDYDISRRELTNYNVLRQSRPRHRKRSNPTKAQKREKAKKASAKRRVATALAGFLKKVNPGTKLAGAKVEKLKGGVLKITPIKANRARSKR